MARTASRRSRSRGAGGTRNGMRAALILCLARTSRFALVPLGYEKSAGDLVGCESAKGAQRKRNLCLDSERRMAAGEDELQALIGKRRRVHGHLGTTACDEQVGLGGEDPLTADGIYGSVPSRRHQPGARV